MVSHFPSFYPDELVYSLLARYYQRSGYMAYTFVAEDLFVRKTVVPNVEFINPLTDDAIKAITRNKTMKAVIQEHTMFPYYGRFLNKEKRNTAFDALVSMQGNYRDLLSMPKSKAKVSRFLRYCPQCVEDDRKQYGETYWHRIHQMLGVNACPLHFCELISSDVRIGGKESPNLVTAEETVQPHTVITATNKLECEVAKYMYDVFMEDVDMVSDVLIGDFLHSRMAWTKYRSVRGEQRNISLLHTDFINHYASLNYNWFTELWQIQKVITNARVNMFEICLLAMFLGISAEELVHMNLPEKTQEEQFDEQIFALHQQGLKYPEIAKRLGASYDVVKAIGEKRYIKQNKISDNPLKPRKKIRDWAKIDADTLPLVREAIYQLQGDGINRPKRVTIYVIEKMLNLPCKQIDRLPRCKAEIKTHYDTQEEYWAREVVWTVNKLLQEGKTLNWKGIRTLTNMRKQNVIDCMKYLEKYTDKEQAEQIKELIFGDSDCKNN